MARHPKGRYLREKLFTAIVIVMLVFFSSCGGGGSTTTSTPSESNHENKCYFYHNGLRCGDGWSIVYNGKEYPLDKKSFNIPFNALIGLVHRKESGEIDKVRILYTNPEKLLLLSKSKTNLESELELNNETDKLSVYLYLFDMLEKQEETRSANHQKETSLGILLTEKIEKGKIEYTFQNSKYRWGLALFKNTNKKVFIPPRESLFPHINWMELLGKPTSTSISFSCFQNENLLLLGFPFKILLLPPELSYIAFKQKENEIRKAFFEGGIDYAAITVMDAIEVVSSAIKSITGVIHECAEAAIEDLFLTMVEGFYREFILTDDSNYEKLSDTTNNLIDWAVDIHMCAAELICDLESAGTCEVLFKLKNIIETLSFGEHILGTFDVITTSVSENIDLPLVENAFEICTSAECPSNFCQDNGFSSGWHCKDERTIVKCGERNGCFIEEEIKKCEEGLICNESGYCEADEEKIKVSEISFEPWSSDNWWGWRAFIKVTTDIPIEVIKCAISNEENLECRKEEISKTQVIKYDKVCGGNNQKCDSALYPDKVMVFIIGRDFGDSCVDICKEAVKGKVSNNIYQIKKKEFPSCCENPKCEGKCYCE